MPPRRRSVENTKQRSRPQAPPPALMEGQEGIEGNGVLEEVVGASAVLLWQSLRDATLWGRAPEPREGLFAPGRERARVEEIVRCGVDAPLIGPLTTLSRMLGSATPPEPAEVAGACRAIFVWADGQGFLRTALAFSQAAAVVCPGDAAAAYRVGWLARRRAEYARAGTWFRRAIGLARRNRDRNAYALAHIGMGGLHMQRREFAAAREPLLRAYRAAKRAGLRQTAAMALHDLFCVSAFYGEVASANEYARGAFRAYGPRHARLPKLAHDVARFWMSQGYLPQALSVFQAIRRHIPVPVDRLLIGSSIARAAAGMGDLLRFADAWNEIWRLVDRHNDAPDVSEALLNLAVGALSLGDAERIEMAATHAMRTAEERQEENLRAAAKQILNRLEKERISRATLPDLSQLVDLDAADSLAQDLVRALDEGAMAR